MQALVRSAAAGDTVPLAERLESMGVAAETGVSESAAYLELRGPREYLHQAVRLTSEVVVAGQLSQDAFGAARAAALHEAERRAHDLAKLANDTFRAARAVDGGVLSRRPEGTVDGLRGLTYDDCRQVLGALPGRAVSVIVAGDADAQAYLSDLGPLGLGPLGAAGPGVLAGWQEPGGAELRAGPAGHLVAAGGKRSSCYLLWGTAVETDDVADHVALEIAAHLLGGWTGSRWSTLFRDKLALTYGVRSAVRVMAPRGRACVIAHVGLTTAASSRARVADLIGDQARGFIASDPDPGEVAGAAVRLLRTEVHHHDAMRSLVDRAGTYLHAGLDPGYAASRISALAAVGADDVGARLRRLLRQPTLVELAENQD